MDIGRALGPLTRKFVWEYTTSSTVSIFAINEVLLFALSHLLKALKDVLVSLLILLLYLLLVLAKISVIMFPFAQYISKAVIEWHYTLSWSDIIIETVTLTIIILYIIFRKRIKMFWRDLEKSASEKFRYMVQLAPHVMFFTFAAVLAVVGQKILLPFTSLKVLPLISILLPVIQSSYVYIRTSEKKEFTPSMKATLLLWVVLGAYHTIATLFGVIPFSNRFLSYIPFVRELCLVILIWIQLSPFFAKIVFDASLPLIKSFASRIPSSDIGASQRNTILSVLKYMKVISAQQEQILGSILQDGMALLFGFLFIFFPSPLAYVGVVIIAFLFPIFRTYKLIYDNDSIVSESKLDALDEGDTPVIDNFRRWLRYWICLGSLWLIKIYVLNFWPSILMFSTLWLQHSYFDGSQRIFHSTMEIYNTLRERDKRIRHSSETVTLVGVNSEAFTSTEIVDESNETKED